MAANSENLPLHSTDTTVVKTLVIPAVPQHNTCRQTTAWLLSCFLIFGVSLGIALGVPQIPSTPMPLYMWTVIFITALSASTFYSLALFEKQPVTCALNIVLFPVLTSLIASAVGARQGANAKSTYAIAGVASLVVASVLQHLVFHMVNLRTTGKLGGFHRRKGTARSANNGASSGRSPRAVGHPVPVLKTAGSASNMKTAGSASNLKTVGSQGSMQGAGSSHILKADGSEARASGNTNIHVPARSTSNRAITPTAGVLQPALKSVRSNNDMKASTGANLLVSPRALVPLDAILKPGQTWDPEEQSRFFSLKYALGVVLLFCHLAFAFWFATLFEAQNGFARRAAMCIWYPLAQGLIARASSFLMPAQLADIWAFASIVLGALPYRVLFIALPHYDDFILILLIELMYKLVVYVLLQLPVFDLSNVPMCRGPRRVLQSFQKCFGLSIISADTNETNHAAVLPLTAVSPTSKASAAGVPALKLGGTPEFEGGAPVLTDDRIVKLRVGTGASKAGEAMSGRFFMQQMIDAWLAIALLVLFATLHYGMGSNYSPLLKDKSEEDIQHLMVLYAIGFTFELCLFPVIHYLRAYVLGHETRLTVSLGLTALVAKPFTYCAVVTCALLAVMVALRKEEY